MTYAFQQAPGDWIEVAGATVELPDLTVSAAWVAGLTAEERAELGFVAIAETPPPTLPEGLKAERGVADVDGVPTRTWPVAHITDEALRAAVVASVKAEAERRILAIMPEWKQRNSLAQGLAAATTYGFDPEAWPAELQAEYAAVMAQWAQIKAIRAASNSIEASAPETVADLLLFDINVGWPE